MHLDIFPDYVVQQTRFLLLRLKTLGLACRCQRRVIVMANTAMLIRAIEIRLRIHWNTYFQRCFSNSLTFFISIFQALFSPLKVVIWIKFRIEFLESFETSLLQMPIFMLFAVPLWCKFSWAVLACIGFCVRMRMHMLDKFWATHKFLAAHQLSFIWNFIQKIKNGMKTYNAIEQFLFLCESLSRYIPFQRHNHIPRFILSTQFIFLPFCKC